jgi:lysophospholipase L1-like esterase
VTTWTTTSIESSFLHGALDIERTTRGLRPHRLPAWAREQFADEYLHRVQSQPSGVRLAFRTRATAVELDVLPTRVTYQGMPAPASGRYDLLVDGMLTGQASADSGDLQVIDMMTQQAVTQSGAPSTVSFSGLSPADKTVEIWLPQTETTELIALRTDSPVESVDPADRTVWLHHGSSISHGSTAASPSATWPALAANLGGVHLVNMGFSGNALLDPFTARAMRDTPADLLSIKMGINLTNTDSMRLRAFTPAVHGFLDTIRERHQATPLLLISPILCPIQEDTPGPIAPQLDGSRMTFIATGDPAERAAGKLTLAVIREELARIVAQRATADANLYYLDGRSLYGEADFAELPLPDGLHPDHEGHRRIGERFADTVFDNGGPFAVAAPRRAG